MAGKKAGLILALFFMLAGQRVHGQNQPLNYSEIFRTGWQKALTFLEENESWMGPALAGFNIPYDEAVAVVFPELVRYSALRDKMEITMLKTLYRNLGDDYANFSIGVFQVKPAFAEEIHERVFAGTDKELKSLFRKRSSFPNKRLYRASIISDLENPEKELYYIIAFYRLCERRFGDDWPDTGSKIRFLATAFNTGNLKNKKEIEVMTGKKFFSTKLFKSETYSYADVALYWYTNFK
ncbi:MAG: hypothetical protein V1903_11410 [Bacteroidota bacterium]